MGIHDHAFRVPPRGTDKIRSEAQLLRDTLQIREAFFPLIEVFEIVLPEILQDDYNYAVVEKREMEATYGVGTVAMTKPTLSLIELRDDVYDGLLANDGWARFTLAHEFGHFFMHQEEKAFARFIPNSSMKIYESSEWQANAYAAELLMPLEHALKCSSIEEMMSLFGVSNKAASNRWIGLEKERAKRIGSLSANSGNHR